MPTTNGSPSTSSRSCPQWQAASRFAIVAKLPAPRSPMAEPAGLTVGACGRMLPAVSTTVLEEALARAYEALATGDWNGARDSFQEATDVRDSPEALDGLGRALWWLRDERGAVVHRERAYAGFRRDGDLARAARIALWLSREYGLAFGNDAASRGWLARAERLRTGLEGHGEHG